MEPLVPPDFDGIYLGSLRISTMGFTCLSNTFSHEISRFILIWIFDDLCVYDGDYNVIPQYCWTTSGQLNARHRIKFTTLSI